MSIEKTGITALGEKKLLFIKINEKILEELAGKPYIEQLKILLGIVREVKNRDGATEEIKLACKLSEKAIIRDMNMVNAELN